LMVLVIMFSSAGVSFARSLVNILSMFLQSAGEETKGMTSGFIFLASSFFQSIF